VKVESAKGAARTPKGSRNKFAPHSVLRVFLKSAKGAARTPKGSRNKFAPHSVLRVFLKRAKVDRQDTPRKELLMLRPALAELECPTTLPGQLTLIPSRPLLAQTPQK
jgi:hypothetical protein